MRKIVTTPTRQVTGNFCPTHPCMRMRENVFKLNLNLSVKTFLSISFGDGEFLYIHGKRHDSPERIFISYVFTFFKCNG